MPILRAASFSTSFTNWIYSGWLLGDIEAVFAQAANQAHLDTPDSRDVLQLLLRFENGVLGSLEMGTAYRLHQWGIKFMVKMV